MKYDELIFNVDDNFYCDRYDLRIGLRRGKDLWIAKPIQFELLDNGYLSEPCATFQRELNLPSMMKASLNKLGLLSNADQATNKALKYHLEDMRKLVFKGKNK